MWNPGLLQEQEVLFNWCWSISELLKIPYPNLKPLAHSSASAVILATTLGIPPPTFLRQGFPKLFWSTLESLCNPGREGMKGGGGIFNFQESCLSLWMLDLQTAHLALKSFFIQEKPKPLKATLTLSRGVNPDFALATETRLHCNSAFTCVSSVYYFTVSSPQGLTPQKNNSSISSNKLPLFS